MVGFFNENFSTGSLDATGSAPPVSVVPRKPMRVAEPPPDGPTRFSRTPRKPVGVGENWVRPFSTHQTEVEESEDPVPTDRLDRTDTAAEWWASGASEVKTESPETYSPGSSPELEHKSKLTPPFGESEALLHEDHQEKETPSGSAGIGPAQNATQTQLRQQQQLPQQRAREPVAHLGKGVPEIDVDARDPRARSASPVERSAEAFPGVDPSISSATPDSLHSARSSLPQSRTAAEEGATQDMPLVSAPKNKSSTQKVKRVPVPVAAENERQLEGKFAGLLVRRDAEPHATVLQTLKQLPRRDNPDCPLLPYVAVPSPLAADFVDTVFPARESPETSTVPATPTRWGS